MSLSKCLNTPGYEKPAEWFLGRDCKFQARLLSISGVLLSTSCPQCPASQRRCSETQHTKWDVTGAAILFYLYWIGRHWGRDAKKRSPAAWLGLVALQVHEGGRVIFTLTSKGVRETQHSLCSIPPYPASPTFSQRQRKTVDNYLVWNFLSFSVCHRTCGCQRTHIWLCFWGHATRLLCWWLCWRRSPWGERTIPKIMAHLVDFFPPLKFLHQQHVRNRNPAKILMVNRCWKNSLWYWKSI